MSVPTEWDKAIELVASGLADANRIEDAWFLRGVWDAMCGCAYAPPQDYLGAYNRGWDAARAR